MKHGKANNNGNGDGRFSIRRWPWRKISETVFWLSLGGFAGTHFALLVIADVENNMRDLLASAVWVVIFANLITLLLFLRFLAAVEDRLREHVRMVGVANRSYTALRDVLTKEKEG